ncbi:hypothetical protein Tco_1309670 [Tanacetum coccineum]
MNLRIAKVEKLRWVFNLLLRFAELRIKRRDSGQRVHHILLPRDLRESVRSYDQYKRLETREVDEFSNSREDIKRHLYLGLFKRLGRMKAAHTLKYHDAECCGGQCTLMLTCK